MILPSTTDICWEILREAAVKKMANMPLSASTVIRRIEEIAEDIETQLLERINTSPWYAPRLKNLQMLRRRHYLFMCDIFIKRMCMRIWYVHYHCKPTP